MTGRGQYTLRHGRCPHGDPILGTINVYHHALPDVDFQYEEIKQSDLLEITHRSYFRRVGREDLSEQRAK